MLYRYILKYNFTLDFYTIKQKTWANWVWSNYVELKILCELKYGTHYTCDHFALALVFVGFKVDQPKTFTLLLKSKSLDFETLSRVDVYRIKYV